MCTYVDNAMIPFRHMKMCHLVADTEEELHAMARRIGMKPEWFQRSNLGLPHYDVSLTKREAALANGAHEISRRDLVRLIRRHREQQALTPRQAAETFNANCQPGTPVMVTRDNGEIFTSMTRSFAWVLGGHTAVVQVEGIAGCYDLARVTPCQ